MRRITEGLELPADWGFFTNVGMTLDTVDPLFGLGSAKYDAANVEYATTPILPSWASYYVWTGKHFRMENPASSGTNWLCGWRSEGTPGSVVEGGCVGVKDSRFCFALGGGPSPNIRSIGRKILLPNLIYHAQFELWFAGQFGWFKIKLNNRVIPDLVFNGITAQAGESFLSEVWIGSLYGGGNGNCWIDDFTLNDHFSQPFLNRDRGYPGMSIIHSVPSNGNGAYNEWDLSSGDKIVTEQLPEPLNLDASGVSGTPISCENQFTAEVPCIVSVHGPITDPVFENETSGESISVTGTVPDGSRLIVNTGSHNVYLVTPDPDNPPLEIIIDDWNALVSVGPEWFTLAPGVNSINVSGAAGNSVVVGWVSYEIGPKDSFTFDTKPSAPTPPTGTADLASVDHVYRMKLEGSIINDDDKVIPGMRRDSADYFPSFIEAHLFPTDVLACHIDRMPKDRATNTPWNPANVDPTEAIFQYSNYSFATAQAIVSQEADFGGPQFLVAPPAPVIPIAPVVIPPPSTPPQPYPPATPVNLVLVSPPPQVISTGNAYYLTASGGIDSGSGTRVAPWKTFAFAIARLNPGDLLILLDGTYNNLNSGFINIANKNGTAAAPITIKAENERQAFISGNGVIPFQGVNSSYLTFQGIRLKSMDAQFSGAYGNVVRVASSHHLTFQRMLVSHTNRYYNGSIMAFEGSNDNLVEECEYYNWSRNGLGFGALSNRNIARRCYANSRNYPDISGGYPSAFAGSGDSAYTIYPGSSNIFENCIAENVSSGLDIQADGPTVGNKILGMIVLNSDRSAIFVRRNSLDGMARDTVIENFVAINIRSVGLYLRGTKNTTVRNATIINGTGVHGFAADVPVSAIGDGSPSFFLRNVLSANNVGTGFYVAGHSNWSLDYCNSYGNSGAEFSPAASDYHITNERTIDPNLGGAKIWIPPTSPMKGAGLGGADIGANVIYRYQNGVLTNTPLWAPGFPHGAIIAGINDIPGSSAYDVHTRLGTMP